MLFGPIEWTGVLEFVLESSNYILFKIPRIIFDMQNRGQDSINSGLYDNQIKNLPMFFSIGQKASTLSFIGQKDSTLNSDWSFFEWRILIGQSIFL